MDEQVGSVHNLQNVWNHFARDADGLAAKCNLCKKSIKTKSGNTTGLHCHLKSHNIQARKAKRSFKEVESVTEAQRNAPLKRVKTGEKLATDMSMHAMLARMTSKSGLTFNVFATDEDLRFCIQAGLDKLGNNEVLPISDKTIKSYVMSYGKKIQNAVHESFKLMKSKGIKFSLTFDEWTSIANKRYINVIVFGPAKMFWSLGLIKITGRATAYRIMELLLERLFEFSIDFNDDVVSITTDGASTMTKLGKEDSLAEHHLCLIHGIHLAVTDLLYAKPKRIQFDTVDESDLDEELSDPYDDDEETNSVKVVELEANSDFHDCTIKDTIKKIRDLGSFFKKSAISTEILQSYVQQQFNNPKLEMPLLVDSKTRWNSLYEMLDRYWRIQNCVDKALIDIKSKVSICQKEKYIISCILITLRPVMEIIESLSCRDSNLVKARVSIIILFKQLLKQTNSLTQKFVRRLHCRIKERWTINYAVLTYLHTGTINNDILKNSHGLEVAEDTLYDYSFDEENLCHFAFEENEVSDPLEDTNFLELFRIPTKTTIKSHIVDLVKRLYQPAEDNDVVLPLKEVSAPGIKSFREILNEALMQVETNNASADTSELSQLGKDLTSELLHLERTKNRIGYVRKIYDCLMTTKPTSVESERAFSLASYLCGKLRSRLNDSTLDTLCFLRSFFRHPFIFDGTEIE